MDCPACHQPNVEGARFCAKCGAAVPLTTEQTGDSLVGQIVGGRYRVTQILGEGGMGRVYLAEQQMGTNVRKVAVKTLQSQFAKDAQVLARFHRECGTVSQLEHPNTIQFFDFGQTPDGQLYIAMEFVQGQSLSAVLAQGPIAPDRVLKIMAQVCGSLEEAHGRGIVHRDLKPDNIILTTRAGQP
ncbi:MAG TPA: serine/threonine-protein kinase, partial [Polyangiaceae bacterium]